MSEQTIVYLTTLRCPTCVETVTVAHDGPIISLDQEAPWPEAINCCPNCGEEFDDDLAVHVVDVHEARRVNPHEMREMEDGAPSNPVQRTARGLSSGVEGGIELLPCPECSSLRTYWDELADDDTQHVYCKDCGASFAPDETIRVDESDLVDGEGSA